MPSAWASCGSVCSLTTDRPGGFADAHLAALREVLPVFALAAKATTMRAIYQGLLAAYLGQDPAGRVLSGTVQRGEVQSVEAVLFFTDLRGFTALADALPGRDLIALLDDCFDCMVRPVVARGGEVLKFLGDGLLAIFRIEDRPRAEICAAALEAAKEALALMAGLAETRRGRSLPTPDLDIALHVGDVNYGNVGADARLDFTVIGPAVNEASRIERLCDDARTPSRDVAILRPGRRCQPPRTGVAWPPSPARRARGDRAVRARPVGISTARARHRPPCRPRSR